MTNIHIGQKLTRAWGMLLFVICLCFSSPTKAQLDLSNQTIEWVIPYSDGGNTSKWVDFFAPLLSEALPGNPEVSVKHMPGKGSTKGANWFEQQTGSERIILFTTSGATQFLYLLEDPRVQFDPMNWQSVIASGTGGLTYLRPDTYSLFDGTSHALQDIPLRYGNQGPKRLDLVAALAWDMLEMNVTHLLGVKSRRDGREMFQKGTATIDFQLIQNHPNDGLLPIMSWGVLDSDNTIKRDPNFPDIPTFKEVCDATSACKISGDEWDAWKAFFIAGFGAQKITFLGSESSPELVATISNAFERIKNHPNFTSNAKSALGPYTFIVGEDAANIMSRITTLSDEARTVVPTLLEKEFPTIFK